MATAQQVDQFNQAILRGDFAGAGALAREAGISAEATTNYLNEMGSRLGLTAPVTQAAVAPYLAPPVSRAPELDQFDALIRAGNFTGAANLAQSKGFSPQQTTEYLNIMAGQLGLPGGLGAERVSTFFTPANQTANFVNFDNFIKAGKFQDAANLAQSLGFSAADISQYLAQSSGRLGLTPQDTGIATVNPFYNTAVNNAAIAAKTAANAKAAADAAKAAADLAAKKGTVTLPGTTTPGTTTPGTTTPGTTTPGTVTLGGSGIKNLEFIKDNLTQLSRPALSDKDTYFGSYDRAFLERLGKPAAAVTAPVVPKASTAQSQEALDNFIKTNKLL